MKILITGATGMVGQELVSQCHEKGYDVNFLTTSKNKLVSEPNYKGFYWNPEKKEIDLRSFEGVSAIINLAGSSISKRWTKQYKKEILASRVDSLDTLLLGIYQLQRHNIKTIATASAIGIYPNSLSNYYTEEENNVDDGFLGMVVKKWEEKADEFKNLGLTVAKIRIGLVLSDKGGALPEMAKPVKNYIGAAFGSGLQWQSWIHLSDLARIFLFVVENEIAGVFNGVSPNPVTNSRLVKEIAKVMERPLILPNVPRFAMKVVLGEMSELLFASQRVSSKAIEEEGFLFHHQNVCSALENIYGNSSDERSHNTAKDYVS
ncbi:TIGR01777 family oxidoreductase [Maribacter sp. MMG018]|uniref:TIGR01777 family oxidoreductase n=1 Tax=Maribacter sp. MMG018 TaxID=2822688 RepID=UPI001B39A01D|nr:TIGR01777 family oxidoreductase [Maribacter sp. MMG018]MBQ4914354.1 TIGR01777 family oxidoreductase [Maribacter sp. MMG018]